MIESTSFLSSFRFISRSRFSFSFSILFSLSLYYPSSINYRLAQTPPLSVRKRVTTGRRTFRSLLYPQAPSRSTPSPSIPPAPATVPRRYPKSEQSTQNSRYHLFVFVRPPPTLLLSYSLTRSLFLFWSSPPVSPTLFDFLHSTALALAPICALATFHALATTNICPFVVARD